MEDTVFGNSDLTTTFRGWQSSCHDSRRCLTNLSARLLSPDKTSFLEEWLTFKSKRWIRDWLNYNSTLLAFSNLDKLTTQVILTTVCLYDARVQFAGRPTHIKSCTLVLLNYTTATTVLTILLDAQATANYKKNNLNLMVGCFELASTMLPHIVTISIAWYIVPDSRSQTLLNANSSYVEFSILTPTK